MGFGSERFALATVSCAGGPGFPVVADAGRAVALAAVERAGRTLGVHMADVSSLFAVLQDWERNFDAIRTVLSRHDFSAQAVELDGLRFEAPFVPRQILCTGANYRQHVIQMIIHMETDPAIRAQPEDVRRKRATEIVAKRAAEGAPYVFAKLPSTVTGPRDPIQIPATTQKADWEMELGVVFGRETRNVTRERALDHVAGYMIVNDITNRDLVFRDDSKALGSDWIMGKSSPTYLPIGPLLVPAAFVPDPQALQLRLKLNGEIKQDASTGDMIFDIARQIEFASTHVKLLPGDLLATGSPHGNGTDYGRFLQPGDVLEAEIDGFGAQRNEIVAERVAEG
jgi:2-keto-4-pentenoate hydratase/2-oxohepta-3-ene-1,7-dioic acid hydratase in catechol pathway